MQQQLVKLGTGISLIAALSGCSSKQDRSSEAQVPPAYSQVDSNTFIIHANTLGEFSSHLAKFRAEQDGTFVAIPRYASYPGSDDAIVFRQSSPTKSGGTNTLNFFLDSGHAQK